jgi:hypothetical protein
VGDSVHVEVPAEYGHAFDAKGLALLRAGKVA